jgi:Zn finger protein HypA/HybF involved in hydrogenase expression
MSFILNYKCTNPNCGLELNLSKNSPVWKEGTPKEKQKIPVFSDAQQYVLETTSKELCGSCNEIVSVTKATYICPNCAGVNTFLKDGDTCPECHVGIIKEDESARVMF